MNVIHAERDLTDMARAMVAVVQAVGPHASMGHVIDVFRGAQPALLATCRRARLPACCCACLPAAAGV